MRFLRLFFVLTIVIVLVGAVAAAQDRGQRGGGAPGGGGGGQRGPAPPPLMMSTTAYPDGGQIPIKYTQAGEQISPALTWTNAPAAGWTRTLKKISAN